MSGPGFAGVVLAGGENRRFPVLKGFIEIDGRAIIERDLGLLREVFTPVFISTNIPQLYFHLGAPMIGDVLPSKGPMAGIYSSLVAAGGDDIFVVACDMPFLVKEVITLVCQRHMEASASGDIAATIPVFNDRAQPLLGVYTVKILAGLEECIMGEKVSLKRLLEEVRTNYIAEADIRAIDPEGRSFVNINTIEDYEAVMRYA